MKKAALLLAPGFEEMEAMTLLSVMTRGGINVTTWAVGGDLTVRGSHGVVMKADHLIEDLSADDVDALVLPGGVRGSQGLSDDAKTQSLIKEGFDKGLLLAAVCAGPTAFGRAGISAGLSGTCYPGFEKESGFVDNPPHLVVRHRNVVTSKGPATAQYLGLALVQLLMGEEERRKVYDQMLYPLVKDRQAKGQNCLQIDR